MHQIETIIKNVKLNYINQTYTVNKQCFDLIKNFSYI